LPAPNRLVTFTNVKLNYLKEIHENETKEEPEINQYFGQKEKFYQSVFKPIFATALFALAMHAFQQTKESID
jgi:hypothetical protein